MQEYDASENYNQKFKTSSVAHILWRLISNAFLVLNNCYQMSYSLYQWRLDRSQLTLNLCESAVAKVKNYRVDFFVLVIC